MKELSTESQKKSILDWLSEGNTITALQALDMFGCLRLASRINDLKNEGFPIAKEMIEVNGKEDIDFYETKGEGYPIMPCATQIKAKPNSCIYSDHWRWRPVINIETGRILNWQQGNTANVHYKVCDGFACCFTDGSSVSILGYEGYVPDFMCPKEEPDGDHIVMDVDENGYIEDWDSSKVKKFVENLV